MLMSELDPKLTSLLPEGILLCPMQQLDFNLQTTGRPESSQKKKKKQA